MSYDKQIRDLERQITHIRKLKARAECNREILKDKTNATSDIITSPQGRVWYLVSPADPDDKIFHHGLPYLSDLQGHRIYRKVTYEGHYLGTEKEYWSVGGHLCFTKESAISAADSDLHRLEV